MNIVTLAHLEGLATFVNRLSSFAEAAKWKWRRFPCESLQEKAGKILPSLRCAEAALSFHQSLQDDTLQGQAAASQTGVPLF